MGPSWGCCRVISISALFKLLCRLPAALMSGAGRSGRQGRPRGKLRITHFDDPSATHLHVVCEEDGSSSHTVLYRAQWAASSASASTAPTASAPAPQLDNDWGPDSGGDGGFAYTGDADPHVHLRDPATTPVVYVEDGRVGAVFVISSSGRAPIYFTELAEVQATDGSRGLLARCTCSRQGLLEGEGISEEVASNPAGSAVANSAAAGRLPPLPLLTCCCCRVQPTT